jgi:ribonuclease III
MYREEITFLAGFEEKTGIVFENKELLLQAFTHRSYLNERRGEGREHNERLEFLGDAVLELVITEFLFKKYPTKPEGDLTAIRAALVNTTSISNAASDLGMNDFLLLSKGEAKDTGRARQYILANTFEALIGALYLDGGYEKSQKFISDTLFKYANEIVSKKLWIDAKSAFQEKAQEYESVTPTYETLSAVGPDHDKVFTVGVFIGSEKIADGQGKSKQEAEQEAAERALTVRGWTR